jgi:hypothetical protein
MLKKFKGLFKIKESLKKVLSWVKCSNKGLLADITSRQFWSGEAIPFNSGNNSTKRLFQSVPTVLYKLVDNKVLLQNVPATKRPNPKTSQASKRPKPQNYRFEDFFYNNHQLLLIAVMFYTVYNKKPR